MNFSSFPQEFETGPYAESTNEMCPYCTGTNTQFIDYEFTNIDDLTHERHFCWDCELDFAVSYHPCPYLLEHVKEHSCSQSSR